MKTLCRIAILASIIVLSACAGPGARTEIPFTLPSGKTGTLVVNDRQVPSWMIADSERALNYMYTGELSKDKLAAIAVAEKTCRIYTGKAHTSNLVAVASGAGLYALAGYAGLFIGSGFLTGITSKQQAEYGGYGASASGFGGAANGIITLGGKNYTFQNCSEVVLSADPAYRDVKIMRDSPY